MFKLKLGASSASKCNVGARGVGDKKKVPTRETDSLSIKYKKSAKVQRVRNIFCARPSVWLQKYPSPGSAIIALAGRGPGAIRGKK